MATLIRGEEFGFVWVELLGELYNFGKVVSPREQPTKELMNVTITVANGLKNVLYNPERKLNFRFLIAEWLWILGGSNDVASIAAYNKKLMEFSDDGLTFSGAYGPRLS